MTPRLSGHFSILGLICFVLKSLLGIAKQSSREKFEILSLKPQESRLNFDISNEGFYGTHLGSSSLLASTVADANNKETETKTPAQVRELSW